MLLWDLLCQRLRYNSLLIHSSGSWIGSGKEFGRRTWGGSQAGKMDNAIAILEIFKTSFSGKFRLVLCSD